MKIRSFLLAVFSLGIVLAACSVPNTSTPVPTATAVPTRTATLVVQPTDTPIKATPTLTPVDSAAPRSALVTVDVSGVAQDVTLQVVAPVLASADASWWAAMPEHTLLTLQGYPITEHLMEPQIFVYRVQDLGANEAAEKVAKDLQTLLQNQQAGERLPYLPLHNTAQVMHAQMKYLDFKTGQGVRFLTWYSQGIVPVNNHGLLYTYQGLTGDGKYYVAAVLPVNLPELPANAQDTDNLSPDFSNNYLEYLADTVANLKQQPDDAYTPDLSKLDAMMQSIEIKEKAVVNESLSKDPATPTVMSRPTTEIVTPALAVDESPIVAAGTDEPGHLEYADRLGEPILARIEALRARAVEQDLARANAALAPFGYRLEARFDAEWNRTFHDHFNRRRKDQDDPFVRSCYQTAFSTAWAVPVPDRCALCGSRGSDLAARPRSFF